MKTAESDPLLYTDEVFKVEPVTGVIWPNSSIDIYVIFKPQEARHYETVLYCDVNGRGERIPLKVKGNFCICFQTWFYIDPWVMRPYKFYLIEFIGRIRGPWLVCEKTAIVPCSRRRNRAESATLVRRIGHGSDIYKQSTQLRISVGQ